jgi:hypothetical protein
VGALVLFQDDAAAHTMFRRRLLSLMIRTRRSAWEPSIRHPPQRDLAAGEERVDTIRFTTTPPLIFLTSVPRPAGRSGHAIFPDPHEVGLLLRENDRALLVLEMLEEYLHLVAFLERLGILELSRGNCFPDLKPTSRMTALSVTRRP